MVLKYRLFLIGERGNVMIAASERFDTILEALKDAHSLLVTYDALDGSKAFMIQAFEEEGRGGASENAKEGGS